MTQDQSCLALGRGLCFYPLGSVACLEYKLQLFFPALQGRRNIHCCLSQTENRNEQSLEMANGRKTPQFSGKKYSPSQEDNFQSNLDSVHLYISFTIPPPFNSQVCESSLHNATSSFFPHMQHLPLPRPSSSFSLTLQ